MKATPRGLKQSTTSLMPTVDHLRIQLERSHVSGIESSVASLDSINMSESIQVPQPHHQLPYNSIRPRTEATATNNSSTGTVGGVKEDLLTWTDPKGSLTYDVYMEQPTGFVNPAMPHHVCKLHKAIYGLRQAPRAWYNKLRNFLQATGFLNSKCDASLFVQRRSGQTLYLLVYVDDIIITCSSSSQGLLLLMVSSGSDSASMASSLQLQHIHCKCKGNDDEVD
ncbi:hypothetical protein LWI28_010893 [Acer negundo]|uniref:Reverse transcriptase Ty1/copia-type domain-containing protein n=1 Tax=Acer negundo TaxID=4023 RepID=A0AAD5ID85_ACENE|nr:hypothetical protein LWI28_010893 [Acer negundo]